MLISELAPFYFLVRIVIAAGFLVLGATELGLGRVALWLFALSEVGLIWIMGRTIRAARATGHAPPLASLFKLWESLPSGVEHFEEVPYWEQFTLDVYAKPGLSDAPTLVYVHPGSWMRGRPGRQARSMFHRLAARGWVVFDIRYPLSPAATFPEHLIGVKRALAWARDGGSRFGTDPRRIVVSGGSSAAHLAALAALTSSNQDLQPGFEDADTSVAACVPFYGIYDLLVRNPTRYDWPFIAKAVMKAAANDDPALYALGSPIDQNHPGAPAFFVVHGEFDSVVLPAESEHFVAALRGDGVPTEYFAVPGGQHGFDAIASLRTRAVANMCVDWLETTGEKAP
jgi:acetyl esterase/lipase